MSFPISMCTNFIGFQASQILYFSYISYIFPIFSYIFTNIPIFPIFSQIIPIFPIFSQFGKKKSCSLQLYSVIILYKTSIKRNLNVTLDRNRSVIVYQLFSVPQQ